MPSCAKVGASSAGDDHRQVSLTIWRRESQVHLTNRTSRSCSSRPTASSSTGSWRRWPGPGLTMRPSWGYVIRALHAEPLPLARLAELPRRDQAGRAADRRRHGRRRAGGAPRRSRRRPRKLLALTADGRRVRATALLVSAAIEAELGEDAPAVRRALLGMAERHGDLEHVRAGRSRALPADAGGPARPPRPPPAPAPARRRLRTGREAARADEHRAQRGRDQRERRPRRAGSVQALEERVAPGERDRLAAADAAEHAEGDEVGELARAPRAAASVSPARAPPRRTPRGARSPRGRRSPRARRCRSRCRPAGTSS